MRHEFQQWRKMQALLSQLGPAKAPADLALRLRVAISQENAKTPRRDFARFQVAWENTIAPVLLQASAGFASTVLLLGTVVLLVGMFAPPEPVEARDEPLARPSAPRFLYSAGQDVSANIGDRDNPVVVEAYVNGEGQVYDFHVVSGPQGSQLPTPSSKTCCSSAFLSPRGYSDSRFAESSYSVFAGVDVRG